MITFMVVLAMSAQLCGVMPSLAGAPSSLKISKGLSSEKQRVSPAQLQQALQKSFNKQFRVPDVALSVEILSPKSPVVVPRGHLDIQVPPDSLNGQMGRRAYRVGLSVNQKFQRMVNVVADIEAHMPLVVPVRFIKLHETIHAKDVRVINYSISTLTQDYVKGVERVIGKKAVRLLAPNMPIQPKFVAEPPVIHKGDRVIIEARHGGLLVQTVGIAKGPGEPGKIITVENQQSKRRVMGRVLEAGLVEVIY